MNHTQKNRTQESRTQESRTQGSGTPRPASRRPRLGTVLLFGNLLALSVPLAGVSLLRLYDSMLIRQTESELIAQGAALAAMYLDQLERLGPAHGVTLGTDDAEYGNPAAAALDLEERFRPGIASLDLARHPVLPPMPPAQPPPAPMDPLASAVGVSLSRVLEQTQRTTLAGLRLVDMRGTVVASSGIETGLNLGHRPEVAATLAGYRTSVLRRRDLESPSPPLGSVSRGTWLRVVVGFPITSGRRVVAAVILARTPMSVRQALYRDRRYFVLGSAVALAAVALLAWITAAALGRPMRALIEQTARVRKGEKGAARPLARPVTREVAQISEAVADMAAALERRADYIATFAANVSHEFKTPLTSIRGTVELLRDHLEDMSPEEQRRFLTMLDKDSERLQRLVDRLLELARADVVRPGDNGCLAGEVLASAVRRYGRHNVDIHLETAPGFERLETSMGAEALDSVLSNLLENALQHGGQEITLRGRLGEGRVWLEIRDDGPGISEANAARIFDRFFTTRRGEGGSGLGLSIVHSLVTAHGGSVSVRSRPGETVFTVELPAASN